MVAKINLKTNLNSKLNFSLLHATTEQHFCMSANNSSVDTFLRSLLFRCLAQIALEPCIDCMRFGLFVSPHLCSLCLQATLICILLLLLLQLALSKIKIKLRLSFFLYFFCKFVYAHIIVVC